VHRRDVAKSCAFMIPGSTFEQEVDPAVWQAVSQVIT
jgi:hypothetical protein